MANIYPSNFRGVVSENADVWLKQLINYCAYKGYDGDKTKCTCGSVKTRSHDTHSLYSGLQGTKVCRKL